MLVAVFFLFLHAGASAGDVSADGEGPAEQEGQALETLIVMPEARAMRPPVMEEIPGSERTIRTYARNAAGDLQLLAEKDLAQLDAEDPDWRTAASRASAELWKEVKIQYLRDPDGVIIAALLEGDTQQTCSLLFDPALVEKMEDVFGPEFFVAVPTRFRMMIFPKLSSRIADFAPVVLSDFRVSPYPVSPEVFEVSREGVRVVGILDDR